MLRILYDDFDQNVKKIHDEMDLHHSYKKKGFINSLFLLATNKDDVCLVCVTEQHYVSIFFTRIWSVCKPLLFDTQNPEISGFSTAHAYKYKTKRQAKLKRDSRKMTFLLISYQATLVLEKHRFSHRP